MLIINDPYRALEFQADNLPSRGGKLTIPEINGLRGLAILGVIFCHATFQSFGALNFSCFGIWLTPYLTAGWHGVNLFFILSAFVLFLPYAAETRDLHAPGAVWRFYRHRALRLLPVYYLIIGAEMVLSGHSPFGNEGYTRETLAVLSFTFPFMSDIWTPSAVNGVVWSLGTEFLFSAAFPLLCWLSLRFGAARVLAVSIPFGFLFRLWGFHLAAPEPVSWLEAMLVGRIDEFLWGFLLAEAFVRGRIPKHPYLFLFLGTFILVPMLGAYGNPPINSPFFHLLQAAWIIPFDVAITLFVAAALAGRSWWSEFLNMRWLRIAGMGCYSLYLWHYPLLFSFHIPGDPWHFPRLAGYVLTVCTLSAVTYRFVEFRNVADWRSLFLLNERPRSSRLSRVVDPGHPLARLARRIDWLSLEERLSAVYRNGSGHPPFPTRLMAGLAMVKYVHDLSDEMLYERWPENPYYQLLCGEKFFCYKPPFDRSSISSWCLGEETLAALVWESLQRATESDAAEPAVFPRAVMNATA